MYIGVMFKVMEAAFLFFNHASLSWSSNPSVSWSDLDLSVLINWNESVWDPKIDKLRDMCYLA